MAKVSTEARPQDRPPDGRGPISGTEAVRAAVIDLGVTVGVGVTAGVVATANHGWLDHVETTRMLSAGPTWHGSALFTHLTTCDRRTGVTIITTTPVRQSVTRISP